MRYDSDLGMATKSEQLQQVIIDRIRNGVYPVGEKLPGLRRLADEFAMHASTVAKVYSDLEAHGVVRMIHGRGTFVVSVPGSELGEEAIDGIRTMLSELAVHARRLGLSRRDWVDLTSQAEQRGFDRDGPAMWFVECSPKDTEELAASLRALLERPVKPLLIDDLPHHTLSQLNADDFFITTPFHAAEVEAAVGESAPVVNVNVVPTSTTLVQLASIDRRERVSVVASNQATLDRFVTMLHSYTRLVPHHALLVDDRAAAEMIRSADVVIDSQSIHDRVAAWATPGTVVTVRYQIEPTSLAYLREVLRRGERPQLVAD